MTLVHHCIVFSSILLQVFVEPSPVKNVLYDYVYNYTLKECPAFNTSFLNQVKPHMEECSSIEELVHVKKLTLQTKRAALCLLFLNNYFELCTISKTLHISLENNSVFKISSDIDNNDWFCSNISVRQEFNNTVLNLFTTNKNRCSKVCTIGFEDQIEPLCAYSYSLLHFQHTLTSSNKSVTDANDSPKNQVKEEFSSNGTPSNPETAIGNPPNYIPNKINLSASEVQYEEVNHGKSNLSSVGVEAPAFYHNLKQKAVEYDAGVNHYETQLKNVHGRKGNFEVLHQKNTNDNLSSKLKETTAITKQPNNHVIIADKPGAKKTNQVTTTEEKVQTETNNKKSPNYNNNNVDDEESPKPNVIAALDESSPMLNTGSKLSTASPKTPKSDQLSEYENDVEFEGDVGDDQVNRNDVKVSKPVKTDDSGISSNYPTDMEGDSYFFSYFMMLCIVFVLGYVGYHNKHKILAIIVEGRRGRRQNRGRRPNSANYHKLDSNLEEAVTSACSKSSNPIIY